MADNAIMIFDGSPTTVISGTGTLATANFSTSSTATETEFDNSSDLWPMAKAVLSCSYSSAPTAGKTVDLYMFEQDISSTNDEAGPSTTAQQGAKYVGSFRLYNTTSQQYQAINISLAGVKKAKFSIYNGSANTMDSDFVVTIEGWTMTPST